MGISPSELYELLLHSFGRQQWWPVDREYHLHQGSDHRFEVIVGAVLTQNTSWRNVEKALIQLKEHKLLSVAALVAVSLDTMKTMIQPSGFFNQKATRLHQVASYLNTQYHGNLDDFFSQETQVIRRELLALNGIGPETADSILLYAGSHPVFVVDAYTRRICKRLPINTDGETYHGIQGFFEHDLQKTYPPKNIISVYQELHALIVACAKHYCHKKPQCSQCPLRYTCEFTLSE